jgi:lysozyme family protein
MKQNFDQCFQMMLKHEGGFSDHPEDPGGITNLGVTLATYEQWVGRAVTVDEMKALTPKDVAPIYKDRYWDAVRGDDLPSGVDWSVFDWAVNSGPGRASRALQRIVGVTADGKIGPVTLKAVHDMKADKIIDKMYDARQHFYEQLSTFDTFGRGWTRRNKETRQAALLLAE